MTQAIELASTDTPAPIIPADANAEAQIIYAIYHDPTVLQELRDIIEPGMFTDPTWSAVYTAAITLDDAGKLLDGAMLRIELIRSKLLPDTNVDDLMAAIAENAFTSVVALSYAAVVREKAQLRGIMSLCASVNRAIASGDDTTAIVDTLANGAVRIAEKGFLDRGKLIGDVVDEVMRDLSEYQGEGVTGLHTGFPELDAKIGGLKKRHLIGVGGAGKIGKSAFAVNIAAAVGVVQRKPVAMISYEMSAAELAERFITSIVGIPLAAIRDGKLTPHQRSRLDQTHAALKECRIVLDDSAPVTIQGLRARLRMLKRTHKIELAVIDYFQLMNGSDPKARRYDALVEVSRGLKLLANELDIPIVILAQLNSEGQAAERPPRVVDIEECKRLFKDANVFILLDRPYERRKHEANKEALPDPLAGVIDVAAIRSGEAGPVYAKYHGSIQRWSTDGQAEDQAAFDYDPDADAQQ